MAYLPHKESQPSDTSSINLSIDGSIVHGYYEQFYPQQLLSEIVHLQIYSSEDYFTDLTSTLIYLHEIVKKSNNK